jgi:hypothetical protein
MPEEFQSEESIIVGGVDISEANAGNDSMDSTSIGNELSESDTER